MRDIRNVVFMYFLCILITTCLIGQELVLETIYGTTTVSDPLILELLETPSLVRMKKIDQHGIHYFRKDSPSFNRYEHSIGVYYLLKKYQAPLIEQAAGLIHDISHTVFSHLSDIIYAHDATVLAYQDSIHHWYLNRAGFQDIAKRYHYSLDDLLCTNEKYKALEQPLPDICIDRLEYNLHTGYVFNMLTKKDIEMILQDLFFENQRWFFKTPSIAKKFASLSLYFTERFWGVDWACVIYKLAATAFQRALNLKVITFDDLHFSTDTAILDKLAKYNDPTIQLCLKKCSDYARYYTLGTKEHHNYFFKPKFRGINPWIKVDNQFFRLTTLDLDFSQEYLRVKQVVRKGLYLNIDLSI